MGMQVRYLLELLQLSPFTHFGAAVDSLKTLSSDSILLFTFRSQDPPTQQRGQDQSVLRMDPACNHIK
jgi:hypothetical protein